MSAASASFARGEFRSVKSEQSSGEQLGHDGAGDVGEAAVAALEAIRELRVVEAELVQNRRVQIVHVDRIIGDVPRDLVIDEN